MSAAKRWTWGCGGLLLGCLLGCGGPATGEQGGASEAQAGGDVQETGGRAGQGSGPSLGAGVGLTPHFRAWLAAHGLADQHFERDDLAGGSFGGKISEGDAPVNEPVIFIHGNSDKATGTVTGQTGFSASIAYLLAHGYKSAELYATTWGPADAVQSPQQYHGRAHLTRLRAFVEAVRAYTGARKLDIVAHSMGVTLARKVIKGGPASDAGDGGAYDLGPPLTGAVDTFVGIAGSNQGLVLCYDAGPTAFPTCGDEDGFYPGYFLGLLGPYDVSRFLQDVNSSTHYEGAHLFSIWSTADEVIGSGDLVWGRFTSPLPGQDGEKRYGSYPYGHLNLKDKTAAVQLRMIRDHVVD